MSDSPDPQVLAALRNNFLFANLDDEEATALAREVWLEHIPARSLIVREGDEADALYLVVTGGVNVTKADGRFLAYLGKDGFFGEMGVFTPGQRRTATCETALDTLFAVVRRDVLTRYCDENPLAAVKIFRAIIRTMSERLQTTSADLAMLMSTQVKPQRDVDDIVARVRKAKAGDGNG